MEKQKAKRKKINEKSDSDHYRWDLSIENVKQNKYWSFLSKDGGELTVSLDLESRSMDWIDVRELNIPKGAVGTKPEENSCI